MAFEQFRKLLNGVGIHGIGGDAASAYFAGNGLALAACAGGKYYFGKHLRVLRTFVSHDCSHAAGSDNDNFCHFFI